MPGSGSPSCLTAHVRYLRARSLQLSRDVLPNNAQGLFDRTSRLSCQHWRRHGVSSVSPHSSARMLVNDIREYRLTSWPDGELHRNPLHVRLVRTSQVTSGAVHVAVSISVGALLSNQQFSITTIRRFNVQVRRVENSAMCVGALANAPPRTSCPPAANTPTLSASPATPASQTGTEFGAWTWCCSLSLSGSAIPQRPHLV